MTWSRRFDDPILLEDGRKLATLRDAGDYIASLPASTQRRPEWRARPKPCCWSPSAAAIRCSPASA